MLAAILLCSSAITLLATGTQLWLDYRYELSAIDERIEQIEKSSLKSLSNSLWEISPEQIQVQLDGLHQLPDVKYLEISSQYEDFYQAGVKPKSGPIVTRQYDLSHRAGNNEIYQVGTLKLIISLEEVYQRLKDKVLVILTTQGIKTFLVSIFILTIFNRLITQHLGTMATYAKRLKLDHLDRPLNLKRKMPSREDELSQVVNAMNSMRESMLKDMQKREVAEQALESLNTDLEQRVVDRTKELKERNNQLQETLQKLQRTQEQLVESEKLAALGGLVAGVAHEINTPIGIGYTAASYLTDRAEKLHKENPDDPMTAMALESGQMIKQNLERANQLISAFKQVSVDQSSEQRRRFDLVEYINEILTSLSPRMRGCQPEILIEGPQHLILDSYPGSFYQIFNNLVINSLLHGFDNQPGGKITIALSQTDESLFIDYKDNGQGVPEGWSRKLFEPFVTTKRNQGCSGLGMHITYNLVSHLLNGHISCLEIDQGAHFQLNIPLK